MKRRLGRPQFIKWLKDNNLYDQHESAANMVKLQAIWKKCQEEKPIMLQGGGDSGSAIQYAGEMISVRHEDKRSTRGARSNIYKFNGKCYVYDGWT